VNTEAYDLHAMNRESLLDGSAPLPQESEPAEFRETYERDHLVDPEIRALLSRRINELSLRIQGTQLEALIHQLYDELEARGVALRPKCYLADEWGCPQDVPVIAIPFYLADPRLSRLEGEMTGVESETDPEIMMVLRHEAGHAFNYAYRLHGNPEWHRIFGPYMRPYREEYRPEPFSDRYVRHFKGWYAQKHPDEDFAETFAVWLTPGSNWQERYAGTPVLEKLQYVDRVAREFGQQPPLVTSETLDKPVEQLGATLAEWYNPTQDMTGDGLALPRVLNEDLRTLFPATEGESAADVVRSYHARLVVEINYWTGLNRSLLRKLLNELIARMNALELKIAPRQRYRTLMGLSVFVTTLVMNYHYTDQFVRR
jgi:hypothetical protein